MDTTPPSPTTGETKPPPAPQEFKALFCELEHCPPSEYEERAFHICLYWRARILAPLIRKLWPGYFDRDIALIRFLANTPGRRDAMNELAAFQEANNSRGSFARKTLRIRISARKTSQLIGQVFERSAERDEPWAMPPRAH